MSSLMQFERRCEETGNELAVKVLIKGLEDTRIFHS